MTSQTLKLQLLSVAVLVSVLSVGASFLMILASGCWQCKPVVSDGSANKQLHVTHSSPLGGEWQSLYHTPPQHSNKKLMSELVGKKREQETTSHPLTARYSAVKRVATVAREGNGATDLLENSQSKAVDMGFRETEENDSHSVPKPVQATQKHRRLSKKRLQAIKALSHNNSVLSDLHLSMARRRRNVSHQNLHSPGRNGSSHHMHTGSSQHSIHSNSTASFKLVPGDQQSAVVLTDLCSDPASQCNEFLPPEEQLLYRSCEAKSVKWHNDRKDGLCQCQFMNTTGHSRVALVSLPGSGNTWLRGLLERATSVCTGSLFCDKTLRAGGMCGEGLREGVLVVKTHDTRLQWTNVAYRNGMWSDTRPFFDAAIVLVRSPFRALIAEWNRQNAYRFSSGQMGNSHVKYLSSEGWLLLLLPQPH